MLNLLSSSCCYISLKATQKHMYSTTNTTEMRPEHETRPSVFIQSFAIGFKIGGKSIFFIATASLNPVGRPGWSYPQITNRNGLEPMALFTLLGLKHVHFGPQASYSSPSISKGALDPLCMTSQIARTSPVQCTCMHPF